MTEHEEEGNLCDHWRKGHCQHHKEKNFVSRAGAEATERISRQGIDEKGAEHCERAVYGRIEDAAPVDEDIIEDSEVVSNEKFPTCLASVGDEEEIMVFALRWSYVLKRFETSVERGVQCANVGVFAFEVIPKHEIGSGDMYVPCGSDKKGARGWIMPSADESIPVSQGGS